MELTSSEVRLGSFLAFLFVLNNNVILFYKYLSFLYCNGKISCGSRVPSIMLSIYQIIRMCLVS